ncbi:hypothetical protein L917_15298, partial [Phytophthora nicotianae]
YYKSLVLGLIDIAIVNSYIVHKAYHKDKTSKPLTHVKFMKRLHLQLTQLPEADMFDGNTFVRGSRSPGAKPHTTAYYCSECDGNAPIYLCMRPRHVIRGELTTCFDVWHKEWSEGKLRPSNQERRIRLRPATPTKGGGSRKRLRDAAD